MKDRLMNFLHHYLVFAFRIFLGGLFIYASVHKLLDPVEFSRIIYGYRILPGWAINLVAIILPGVELIAGIFLVLGLFSRGAVVVISFSLLVFIFGISFNIVRGHEFDCGCFSFTGTKHGAAVDLLIRDVVFLCMSIVLFFSRKRVRFSIDGLLHLGEERW
jgi:putative oxidoreductase